MSKLSPKFRPLLEFDLVDKLMRSLHRDDMIDVVREHTGDDIAFAFEDALDGQDGVLYLNSKECDAVQGALLTLLTDEELEGLLSAVQSQLPERRKALAKLQKVYAKFEDFLWDVITEVMGFRCTDLQIDIARFLESGPLYRMIQAQRGQAKTTITAIYAVWRLIHNPRTRVLIVSAGGDLANEIANWVIQIIKFMPVLECMRPDKSAGDRSSIQSFDIHYTLKGAEKSPSVACMGVTSNIQGRRADILIADDVESKKNSATEVQRGHLLELTRDFSSICKEGDIIYLGTPQSIDSVYNTLPSRGYEIRIWTGRYPTEKELPNYNGMLAPMLMEAIKANPALQTGGGPTGARGQVTDPVLASEEVLTAKEIDQGKAYFQLQHMLDTALMDQDRYPLKSEQIIFSTPGREGVPAKVNWVPNELHRIHAPVGHPLQERYYRAVSSSAEFVPFQGIHMYVDPAGGGQNGDELAYAVTALAAGKVWVLDIGGTYGGYEDKQFSLIINAAAKWKPHLITIESNYGNGAFRNMLEPKLLKKHRCGIEDMWETGQKELRIIDILEPMISGGRLIMPEDIIDTDWRRCMKYPIAGRQSYSLMFQLARITREKGCLKHDDRLDALAGSCRHWVDHLRQDEDKAEARARADRYNEMMKNPLGDKRPVAGFALQQKFKTMMDKYTKKRR